MRKLKWILGGLFTLLVALAVAAYAVVSNYDAAKLKAMIQEQVKTATGRDLDIRGDLAIRFSLTPSVVMNDVHFANAPWAATPDMATMQRLEVEVELLPLLSGDVEIARLVLVQPTIALVRNAQGEANWDFAGSGAGASSGSASGGSGDATSSLSFHAVQIDQATVTFHDEATGRERSLHLDSLTAEGDGPGEPLALAAAGTMDGAPFNLTGSLGSLDALTRGQPTTIKLDGTLADATLALSGEAAPASPQGGGKLSLSLQGGDLAALSELAGSPLPKGPFKLAAALEQDGSLYHVTGLTANLGSSDIAGNLDVDLGGERPNVTGALVSRHFALVDLRSGVTDSGQPAPKSDLIPADALPVAPLAAVDGKLTLSIGELVLDRTTAKDLQATVTLDQGKLVLEPLSFNYGGGQVSSHIELDATQQPPQVVMKLTGSGIDPTQLTDGGLSGTMALALDVQGRGDSPKAIAASLTGQTELSSAGGTLNNVVMADTTTGLLDALLPLMGDAKRMPVICTVNRMTWKDGIGTSRGTALATESFTVVGNGTVNLKTETLDFYLDTATSDSSLVKLAVPLRAQGPLTSPNVTADPAGTALGVAKAAGLLVFPPTALAAIIGDKSKKHEANPCIAAIQEVEDKGGPLQFFQDAGTAAGKALDDAGSAIEKGADDTWKGLQDLLGN